MSTAEPIKGGLRELKRMRAEERLVDSAMALFLTRGFEQTSLQEIAQAAGIAPRNVFQHVSTKEELVAAWQDRVRTDLLEAVAEQKVELGPLAMLEAAILKVLLPHAEEHLSVSRLIERTPALAGRDHLKEEELERTLSTALWTRFGGKLTELEAGLAASVAILALRTARRLWLAEGGRGDPAPYAEKVFALLREGVLATGR